MQAVKIHSRSAKYTNHFEFLLVSCKDLLKLDNIILSC